MKTSTPLSNASHPARKPWTALIAVLVVWLLMPSGLARAQTDRVAPPKGGIDEIPVAVPIEVPTAPAGASRPWLALALLGGVLVVLFLTIAVGTAYILVRRRNATDSLALSVPCSTCGRMLHPGAGLAGKKVRCGKCGGAVPVPSAPPATDRKPKSRMRFVLAAILAVLGLTASIIVGSRWLSACEEPPYESQLQGLADMVKTLQADSIDARQGHLIVADRDLACLRDLPNLKKLNLDGSPVTDAGMKDIARATGLVSLSLSNTQVTDAGLAALATLTDLEELRLDKLPITDAGLAHVAAFPKLKQLSLWQTLITDNGLAHLKSLTSLERLSVDETAVSDAGLKHLYGLSELKYFSKWRTRITGAGVKEFKQNMPSVKVNPS